MRKFIRLAILALCVSSGVLLCVASMTLAQQTTRPAVEASEIFPLLTGDYIAYDVFPTDTNGVPTTTTPTHGASSVITDNSSFAGSNGVSVMADSSASSGSAGNEVSNVRYMADGLGDVHAYADQNFLALFAPASICSSVTAPDSFVNYLALSPGRGVPYHILSLSQKATYESLPLTIAIELNGEFRGIEHLRLPAGEFDSAYHFVMTADLKALLHGQTVTELVSNEEIWLVPGIGIVKTNTPTTTNPFITVPGSEHIMVSYQKHKPVHSQAVVEGLNAVNSIALFPNPANAQATVQLSQNMTGAEKISIDIYAANGSLVRSIGAGANKSGRISFDTQTLASGDYLITVRAAGLQPTMARLSVSH